jgi:peptidoglycan/LPS O-acetylase OafA/YrhL
MPFVPVKAVDTVDVVRSRRGLQFALCLHLLLLLAFGTYTLQPSTLTSVRDYAYEFYCTHLPPGLIGANAGPASVLVARIMAVSADKAIASAVGVFSFCAAVFTALLLDRMSYYIKRLPVDDRDSLL